jgi:hypothetical protein
MKRITLITVLIAVAGWLAAGAMAAQPHKGALYTGHEGSCNSTLRAERLTCTFRFRVSKNGSTMRLVSKQDVAGAFGCPGGGGFAVFGSHKYGPKGSPSSPGETVPVLKIKRNGSFSGKSRFYEGTGRYRSRVTMIVKGRFTGTGKKARLTFYIGKCFSPVKLTAH